MKLICERDALAGSLAHAARRAEHKSKIPILQQVMLEAASDKLSLTATDLDSRCVATCPAEIAKPGATTVTADRLMRLVEGMPKGSQVTLELKGSDLHVVCGRSRYNLQTLPVEDFPEMSAVEGGIEFSLKADDAKRLFADPVAALPANDSRMYFFGGFLSQQKKGQIMVTGCDGMRLVRLVIDSDAKLERGYLIPKPVMPELVKMASNGDLALRFSDNLMEAASGNVVLKSKLIDATYPDTDRVIPQKAKSFILCDRAEFVAALNRLVGVEDDKSSITIRWKSGEKSFELSSTGSGFGTEEVACECDLPDGQIRFSRDLLGGMVDVGNGAMMQLHITGPGEPVLIVDPNDKGLTVVAMPLRA